jgi:murein DD-endopeptidase MepM/ murein hydrolase activator NlpD
MVVSLPKGGKTSPGEEADSVVQEKSGSRSARKSKQTRVVDPAQASSQSSLSPSPGKSSRAGSRQRQAIGDAQESLTSLLRSPADTGQPAILSPSGAVRNPRGRIASPSASTRKTNGATRLSSRPNAAGRLIEGNTARDTEADSSERFLAIVPRTLPLYEDDEVHDVPQSRFAVGLQIAGEQVQVARERVSLLIGADPDAFGLGPVGAHDDLAEVQSSRRQAARWATRYATHMVILLVVGALVAFGGLKALTVQSAFPNGLHAVDSYGTDYFLDDEESEEAIESHDYALTLPRTELGGTDAASNSFVYVAPVEGRDGRVSERPTVRTSVTAYTVQAGDTVESVAAKFDVLPETVMGSNGIWDSAEELAAGRVLQVPPIDGMYYVPVAGDTVESVARKFQADPALVRAYGPNNVASGVLTVGQPILVPGGMMPMREVAITYVTRKGDTLKKVAARFAVDVPTLVRANDVPDPAYIPPGTSLRVLPVAGMEYRTQTGDTVFSVADKFGVSTQMILDFTPNGVSAEGTLPVDRLIVVPGGSPPSEVAAARLAAAKETEREREAETSKPEVTRNDQPAAAAVKPQTSASKPLAPKPPTPKPVATPKPAAKPEIGYTGGSGTLGWPLKSFVITQYYSGRHNGLDLAAPAGNNIYAAGSGTVIWSGWRTDGLGYCVFIEHGNGLTTVYGHMIRQPRVYVGQHVSRGQLIGNVGSTGRSTGPHVHFMVKVGSSRSYRNPLSYLGKR